MKNNLTVLVIIGDILKKEENICLTCDEICEYIEKEVKPGDTVRLSLGRCYIPGRVVTNVRGVVQLEVEGEIITGLTCIDVGKLRDSLVEVVHECEDKKCIIEAKD